MPPDGTNWDPYSTHFAIDEVSMLDYDETIRSKKMRRLHKLDQEPDPIPVIDFDSVVSTVMASTFSSDDTLMEHNYDPEGNGKYIDANVLKFGFNLNRKTEESKFGISIGSTCASLASGELFFSSLDVLSSKNDSSTATNFNKGISPQFLSNIWHINTDLAGKVLDQSTQLQCQGGDNELSRLLSTNEQRHIHSQFFTDTFFVTLQASC